MRTCLRLTLAAILVISLIKAVDAQAPGAAFLLSPPNVPVSPPVSGLITFSPNPLSVKDNAVTSGQKVANITLAPSISGDTLAGTCREQSTCPWQICGATGNWGVCAAATLNSSYDVVSDHYDVTASAPPPPPPGGCTYGAHGAVRGRPSIVTSPGRTIVADDGCLLVFTFLSTPYTIPGGPTCYNQNSAADSDMQVAVNQAHVNTLFVIGFLGDYNTNDWDSNKDPLTQPVDPCNYGQLPPISGGFDILAYLDAQVAATQRNGLYLEISSTVQDCFFSEVETFWNAVAPRYANATNVIYSPMSEPEGCYGWGPNQDWTAYVNETQKLYNIIRAAAPNIMVNLISSSMYGYGAAADALPLLQGMNVDWTKTYFNFHAYEPGPVAPSLSQAQNFILMFTNAGFPVGYDQGDDSTDPGLTVARQSISMGISYSDGLGSPSGFTPFWPKD